jgi:hypothetical protein
MTLASARAPRWRPIDLWRTLAGLVVVVGVAAGLLAFLDAVPAWIAGEPHDVRRVSTVAEAERRLGARLILPGYFPSTIGWPPSAIRVVAGRSGGAALHFSERRGGGDHMLLVQAGHPGEPVPPRLLPEATHIDESPTLLGGERVVLARIVGPEGEVWRELTWSVHGRTVVLRSRGTVEEMMRMARTAREEP